MDHGPDTEELLRRVAAAAAREPPLIPSLRVDGLRIHSLPPLPENLMELWCYRTQISELPPLPAGLLVLHCMETQVKSLPPLPPKLRFLICCKTAVKSLPELPTSLVHLDCSDTQITMLPRLPPIPQCLDIRNLSLPLLRENREQRAAFITRWNDWWDSRDRQLARCRALKEELMAAAWAPARVERWVSAGRWDMID
jgi:Leucine-rich repeat (LRR) protein